MGITGLHQIIQPILKKRAIESYKGHKIGIDGHAWLYKMAHIFAEDLFYGNFVTKHAQLFIEKLDLLKSFKIVPIVVFDGDALISKEITNNERREKKDEVKKKINELLSRGKNEEAKNLMKQCISISEGYLKVVIEALIKYNYEYIVSPYESDAELTYLQKIGYIDYILSEDSDLVAYKCNKILYKFDGFSVFEYNKDKLHLVKDTFFAENITEICVFSGCDYLKSIKGVGLLTAYKLFTKHKTVDSIIEELGRKKKIENIFLQNYENALVTFKEHIVYNPITKSRLHLSGKLNLDETAHYAFLGKLCVSDPFEFAMGNFLNLSTGPLIDFLNKKSGAPKSEMQKGAKIVVKDSKKENKKNAKEVIVDTDEYSPFFEK